MRKLLLLLAITFAPASLVAQGAFIPPQTALKNINGIAMPIANATVTVCAAGASGIPCAPALVGAIFSNSALTTALANPFTSDAYGNYQFAANPLLYSTVTVTVTASGFTGQSYQVSLAASGSFTALVPSQYATVSAAIAALPASGGSIYIACGYSGVGPTTIPSNTAIVSLCAPENMDFVGNAGALPVSAVTQVTLTYTSNLNLTAVQNIYLQGLTLFMNGNGVVLTSSAWNRFEGVTLDDAGGLSQPALKLATSTSSCTGCNTVGNMFHYLQIKCGINPNYTNYAIQTAGLGPANTGTAVTDNFFDNVMTEGGCSNGVDVELNSDSNHWRHLWINTTKVGGGTCGVILNQSLVGSDIDADANDFSPLTVTSYTSSICEGTTNGNSFDLENAIGVAPVTVLGGTQTDTIREIGFFGTPGVMITPILISKLVNQEVANTFAGTSACVTSTKAISFPATVGVYANTPSIIVSDETTAGGAKVSTKSVSGFTVTCTGASDAFDWIAVGNPN
jgi:hypothetical protein